MKLVTILVLALIGVAQAPTPAPIFDGTSFAGWEGDLKSFRIEQGAIVAGSLAGRVPRNEFLCTTKTYGDFELRFKVKLVGDPNANGGVQFRSARVPNDREVSGYQADLGQNYWGSLYDESRRNKTLKGPDAETIKRIVKVGDWNDYVVRAQGRHIVLTLNGTETVDYTEDDPAVAATGVICVQIHSGPPSEVWYKDLSVAGVK